MVAERVVDVEGGLLDEAEGTEDALAAKEDGAVDVPVTRVVGVT